jgi:integrase
MLDGAPGMSDSVGIALKLILVTGQRSGEVAGMRLSEIEGEWWTLPGARTKNGKAHRVPLTPLALELLGRFTSDGDEVFPASRRAEGTLLVSSLAHAIQKSEFLGLRRWTPHDLRRTAATRMASAGVQPHIIDRLLNHTDPSVRARYYDQYLYDAEKRSALGEWEGILIRTANIDCFAYSISPQGDARQLIKPDTENRPTAKARMSATGVSAEFSISYKQPF